MKNNDELRTELRTILERLNSEGKTPEHWGRIASGLRESLAYAEKCEQMWSHYEKGR